MSERITKTKLRLGKKIQRIRGLHHLTQEELSEKLNISRTHLGHVEQGRKSPSMKLLEKIAKILKVKPQDLFP